MIKSTSKSKSKSKSNQQICLPDRQTTNYQQQTIPTLCALLLALCLLTFTSTTTATIRYVSHTGSSTPPYTTWETAADSIQKAIDVCEPGDTVLVANGVYYENLIINVKIALIGSSMDSTVIDGRNLTTITVEYLAGEAGGIENFMIIGKGFNQGAVILTRRTITIKNCRLTLDQIGLSIINASVIASNLIIDEVSNGIFAGCLSGNCVSNLKNSLIIVNFSGSRGININIGGTYYIDNNIIIYNNDISLSDPGIFLAWPDRVYITNNLISGFRTNIFFDLLEDSAFIKNNLSIYKQRQNNTYGIHTFGDNVVMQNNIIAHNPNTAIGASPTLVNLDYNLFWENENDLAGITYGDSDRVADPMFVSDTVPTPNSNYDFHLQAFSPGIDAGNPDILDVDGSRSDIGMYGGPLGQAYKYPDLAPKAPRNLSAVVDTNFILVKWNRNTEADTSHYRVYRDTVTNFTIDSTKLIASPTDTFFIQLPPYEKDQYVYKITCVDNQGNESLPSEEVVVKVTDVSEYPMIINDYILYQNYPNPFNPSTKIAYKLKERAYVKLMVYDLKGELISVLVNKDQEPGYYEVEFNVGNGLPSVPNNRNLASGIYLYRIEVIGEGRIPVYSDMKKMVLIK